MVELKNICNKILTDMREINNNSCIAWVGGTATDYLNSSEPYDYDINIYGVSYEQIVDIISEKIGIWRTAPRAGIVRAWAPSGKKIDVFLATKNFYSEKLGMWKWDLSYYDYLLQKNIHHKKVEQHSINNKVPRFSNACVYVHYPSMDIISREKYYKDFKEKRCRSIRNQSRYVFSDYIRAFKYVASGYKLDKKTKQKFIQNSLVPYFCWKDKFSEDDNISIYQDIFLRNLEKVYGYEQRSKSFYPRKFYDVCKESGIFTALFSSDFEDNPNELSTKEKFLKSVFDNDTSRLKKRIEDNYTIKQNFEFEWLN